VKLRPAGVSVRQVPSGLEPAKALSVSVPGLGGVAAITSSWFTSIVCGAASTCAPAPVGGPSGRWMVGAASAPAPGAIAIERRSTVPPGPVAVISAAPPRGAPAGAVYVPLERILPALACHVIAPLACASTAANWTLVPAVMRAGAPSIITRGRRAAKLARAARARGLAAVRATVARTRLAVVEVVPIACRPTGPWL
jgi:hypothetical protein